MGLYRIERAQHAVEPAEYPQMLLGERHVRCIESLRAQTRIHIPRNASTAGRLLRTAGRVLQVRYRATFSEARSGLMPISSPSASVENPRRAATSCCASRANSALPGANVAAGVTKSSVLAGETISSMVGVYLGIFTGGRTGASADRIGALINLICDSNSMKHSVFLLRYLLVIVGSGLLLAGCGVNPVTGSSEMSFMSEAEEIRTGEQQYEPSQQSEGGQYVLDPELTRYVQRVGMRLARVSDRPELPYEFVLLNNSEPNAWALPGGKIALNRGLLVLLESEAQLAAVLGHEIVHCRGGSRRTAADEGHVARCRARGARRRHIQQRLPGPGHAGRADRRRAGADPL